MSRSTELVISIDLDKLEFVGLGGSLVDDGTVELNKELSLKGKDVIEFIETLSFKVLGEDTTEYLGRRVNELVGEPLLDERLFLKVIVRD